MSRGRHSGQVIIITVPGAETMKCVNYKELLSGGQAQSENIQNYCDLDGENNSDFCIPPEDHVHVSSDTFNGTYPLPAAYIDDVDDNVDDLF